MRQTMCFLAIGLAFCAYVLGQGVAKPATEDTNAELKDKARHYEQLKEIDLGFLKISIPATLVQENIKCIEGGCREFSDGEMVLSIDRNVDAWRPRFEKTYPTYAEEIILVDNVRARLWSFEDNGQNKFISGANYATKKDHRIGLGIYLSSKTIDSRRLAKAVFSSVKFSSSK